MIRIIWLLTFLNVCFLAELILVQVNMQSICAAANFLSEYSLWRVLSIVLERNSTLLRRFSRTDQRTGTHLLINKSASHHVDLVVTCDLHGTLPFLLVIIKTKAETVAQARLAVWLEVGGLAAVGATAPRDQMVVP